VEIDYPEIQNHWIWYMQIYSDPPPEHAFKDFFIIDCEVSWRTVTIIGLTIGGSVLFVCIIGFCALLIWPFLRNCMRRNQIEYHQEKKKPKKDKRRYRDAYRRKKVPDPVPDPTELGLGDMKSPKKEIVISPVVEKKEKEEEIVVLETGGNDKVENDSVVVDLE
jgi:hypothetical protein